MSDENRVNELLVVIGKKNMEISNLQYRIGGMESISGLAIIVSLIFGVIFGVLCNHSFSTPFYFWYAVGESIFTSFFAVAGYYGVWRYLWK